MLWESNKVRLIRKLCSCLYWSVAYSPCMVQWSHSSISNQKSCHKLQLSLKYLINWYNDQRRLLHHPDYMSFVTYFPKYIFSSLNFLWHWGFQVIWDIAWKHATRSSKLWLKSRLNWKTCEPYQDWNTSFITALMYKELFKLWYL